MDWYTFAADMARAIALVTAINVPLAAFLIFLARRRKVEQPILPTKNPGTFRPCENNSTRRRGARLIQAGCYLRNKDSSRQHFRFFYCAFTTSRGVFTQPALPGA